MNGKLLNAFYVNINYKYYIELYTTMDIMSALGLKFEFFVSITFMAIKNSYYY